MISQARATIKRFAMTAAGERVAVAVSGGADSTALLAVLCELREELGIELAVVHLNHRLRGEESDHDEQFVRRMAEQRQLPFHSRAVDVESMRGNLEQAGRRARYAFFEDLIAQGTVDKVATAHTRNDQAETLLFRLLRGSGRTGLAAVRPLRAPGVIRPLIDVRREQIEDYLAQRGLAWRDDPSNADRRFARNRIRRDLLPQLERDWNPQLIEALARTAAQSAEEEDYWRGETDRAAEAILRRRGETVNFSAAALAALHPALARRLLRRAVADVRGDLRGFSHGHVDQIWALAQRPSGDGSAELPGLKVSRSFADIRLESPAHRGPAAAALELHPPLETAAPDGRSRIRIEIDPQTEENRSYTNSQGAVLDWRKLVGGLGLRAWRAGDRLETVKLKDLFQRARVASWDRAGWPVVVAATPGGDESVVWTRGFGPASNLLADESTRVRLRICEIDTSGREIKGIRSWAASV